MKLRPSFDGLVPDTNKLPIIWNNGYRTACAGAAEVRQRFCVQALMDRGHEEVAVIWFSQKLNGAES